MLQLDGFYQYPGRAARELARLTLNDRHLTLMQDGHQQVLLLKEVQVSDALGTIPLTLTFPDGGRFVPQSDAQFRQWWQQRHRPGLVHRLERYRRGVALTLLATLASIALWLWVILPAASDLLARNLPDVVARQVGQQTQTLLRHGGFSEVTLPPAERQRLQQLFSRAIPPELRDGTLPLQLKVMHFDGGANAFMLADGTLIVSDDLLKLAKSDDALVAVMLHEMGHHHHRHPLQMLVRSSLVTLGYMWLTGDVSGIGDTILQSAAFVDQMQFSRGMEREADEYAIAQMQAQGRSLAEMQAIYTRLQQEGDRQSHGLQLPEWISSHPDMPERIKAIQDAQPKP